MGIKNKKKIVRIVFDEVYRRDVLFIAGCSLEKANKELKDRYKIPPWTPDVDPKGIMRAIDENESPNGVRGTALFIWIEDRKDFYTLLHEVTHLCVKIFELSSMDINAQTTEAFAFYHEFWFKKLWRLMNKK